MTGTNELLELLTFSCPACRAQLTVPARLAGIEGPCPSCYQAIRAPLLPAAAIAEAPVFTPPALKGPESCPDAAVSGMPVWDDDAPVLNGPPPFPQHSPSAPVLVHASPAVVNTPTRGPQFDQLLEAVPEKTFKARLAIRPPDEPPDDTWRDRHRDQARGRRRVRRAERAAQSFLDSRTFRLTRTALILLSGGMMTWLFLHMKDNQWNFPGLSQPLANESNTQPAVPPLKSPAASQPLLMLPGDDDTEMPVPSENTPRAAPGNGIKLAAPPP